MGRKRQRSRATLTDDDEQAVATIDESESTEDYGSKSYADDDDDDDDDERLTEGRKREVDGWDAFKEEHHEGLFPTRPRRVTHDTLTCPLILVLEQLPLSLHRQFKLMRELDSQSEGMRPRGPPVSVYL